jgi:O-antigen/teichoic acid export membrane protein
MVKQIKNEVFFSSVKIMNSLLRQAAFFLLFYVLSIDDFGYFVGILAISILLQVFTTGLTYGAFINFSSKSYSEFSSYSKILYYRLFIAICVVSFVFLVSTFIEFTNKFLILKLYLGLVFYDLGSQLLLPGNKRIQQVIIESVFFIALFATVILFVNSFNQYINYYLILSFFLFIISFSFFYFHNFKKSENVIENYYTGKFKFFFKYSSWQLVGIIGIYVMGNGMNLYAYFYNFLPSTMAIYGIVLKIFMSLAPIYGLFVIYIPKLIRNNIFLKYDRMPYLKTLFMSSFALTLLYLIVIITFQELIIYFNKVEYAGINIFLVQLIPAYFFMSFTNITNTLLANTQKYIHPQFIFIIQAIVMCISYIIFIPIYEMQGFLISVTLAYLVSFILFLYVLVKDDIKLL